MQRLIDFVLKYKEYISFAMLIIISLALISMGDVNRIGGFRTVVVGSVGWLQNVFSWIPNPGALRSENRALRELNLQLSSEVSKMRHSLVENKTLREMVELKRKTDFPLVAAEVVGKSTVEMRNYITINKGYADGIRDGMAVRTDAGLVGIVVGVNTKYSLVESIRNRELKVASKVQRSRIDGLVVWEGGEEFVLKNVPRSFDVKQWDMIVTSDYSDKYPADIPIGKISALEEDRSDLFLKIRIKPEVNFSSVEEVFVIKYIPDPERNALIRQLDELLKARKK